LLEASKNPLARLHALCTLDGLRERLPLATVVQLFRDPHPMIRAHMLRISEQVLRRARAIEVEARRALPDPEKELDVRVRMQLAYSLGEWIGHESAGDLLGRLLLRDGEDPYMRAAILSSANKDNISSIFRAALAGPRPVAPAVLSQLLRLASVFG